MISFFSENSVIILLSPLFSPARLSAKILWDSASISILAFLILWMDSLGTISARNFLNHAGPKYLAYPIKNCPADKSVSDGL